MFGSNQKKETTQKKSNNGLSGALNSLVKGTHIEGTLSSENDIRIDGTIKGTLVCKSKVIIGPSGFVDGEIKCKNALIEGRFIGTLNVQGLLHIKESADITGEITTTKLIVDPGAIFNVSCNMSNQKDGNNGLQKESKQAQASKASR